MQTVKIITDSGCDLSPQMVEEAGLKILPFSIIFGDEVYKEYYELTPRKFYEKWNETGVIPKTSQVTPVVFEEAFKEALDEYETVIYAGLSETLSSTANSAKLAKQMVEEENPNADIVIIDSKTASFAYGIIMYKAGLMAKDGKTKDEIVAFINDMVEKMNVYFVINNLEYLKAGGRISSTKLMLGTFMDIKPLMKLEEGKLLQFEKIRGSKNVIRSLVENVKKEIENIEEYGIILAHSDCSERLPELKTALLGNEKPAEYYEFEIGSAIGTHAGPGVLGVFFWKK